MSTVRAAGILLGKELRLEFRSRELLSATIIFALVVVVLFSFAFDPTAAESRRYGPGLLWIAFLFAGSLMLNPSSARALHNANLVALRPPPCVDRLPLRRLADAQPLFRGRTKHRTSRRPAHGSHLQFRDPAGKNS